MASTPHLYANTWKIDKKKYKIGMPMDFAHALGSSAYNYCE